MKFKMASSATKLYHLYQKSRGLDVTFSKAKLPIGVFPPHVEFSIHYKKWKRRMHLQKILQKEKESKKKMIDSIILLIQIHFWS
jgi:hypothetical protein